MRAFCISQIIPLQPVVNLSIDTSGSYLSTLNGIFFPRRRDSVGPWLALLVSSIGHGIVTLVPTDILFR